MTSSKEVMDTVDDIFAFPTTSPESLLQQPCSPQFTGHNNALQHDYNFSGTLDDESTDISTDQEADGPTEDECFTHELLPSGRSSISSFPASIIHHHPPRPQSQYSNPRTPPKSPSLYRSHHESRAYTNIPTFKPPSPLSTRDHPSGFRNPSSVRAMQMRDEYSDLGELIPSQRHRRRNSRMSYVSYRSSASAQSSPSKRLSRSSHNTPQKSSTKLRKEFPLVLLHCNLLPPLLSPKEHLLGDSELGEGMREAILPEPYAKRWKTLQEKVVRSSEVRSRGVLIPHPREEYELLEERLLESLELEGPRLERGHFVERENSRCGSEAAVDSGFESAGSSQAGEEGDPIQEERQCPDCGAKVESERRWVVKVYAANGLMKAGAWGAAWMEMEKVDVEVGIWMPYDVRMEVDARLEALIAQEQQEEKQERAHAMDERTKEIYGDAGRARRQDEIDGLYDDYEARKHRETNQQQQQGRHPPPSTPAPPPTKAELQDVLANYIRLLAQDRRNIAIALLSMLVLFYAMSRPPQVPASNETAVNNAISSMTAEPKVEFVTTTVVSTSTSVALETSTITQTAYSPIATGTASDSGHDKNSETLPNGALQTNAVHTGAMSLPTVVSAPAIYEDMASEQQPSEMSAAQLANTETLSSEVEAQGPDEDAPEVDMKSVDHDATTREEL